MEYIYIDGQPMAIVTNGSLNFIHNDHLGTPQQISDATQAIVWQADYSPFGEATVTTETIVNNLRFPGQYYDEETGLYYNYHRYYDPRLGRYITADPIGLKGSINLYLYVDANPIKFIDPKGLISLNPFDWIGLGIGKLQGALCAKFFFDQSGCAIIKNTAGGPALMHEKCDELFKKATPPSGTPYQILECELECRIQIKEICNANVCIDIDKTSA